MTPVAKYRTPSGSIVLVELDPEIVGEGFRPASGLDAIRNLDFESFLEPLANLLASAIQRFREAADSPSEIEVTAGVKFGVEGQIIIAKGSAEANLAITVKYETKK